MTNFFMIISIWLKEKPRRYIFVSIPIVIAGCVLSYILWLRPFYLKPLSEPLQQIVVTPHPLPPLLNENIPAGMHPYLQIADLQKTRTAMLSSQKSEPVCGDLPELTILLVGIDYGGDEYLYGLADVIRIVRVDFTQPAVNVVTLPRALLVQIPEDRIQATGPLLLNQAYFFGSAGMQRYVGEGYGAGSLAETIQYNFGIEIDHYLVMNFESFVYLIDSLGGISVDLPAAVDDHPIAFYPAGVNELNGMQALHLARVRRKYSDLTRIENQTLILKAVFHQIQQPSKLAKLPQLTASMTEAVLTDASLQHIQKGLCLLRHLERNDLHFHVPPDTMILYDWEYIPVMKQEMNIFRWDAGLVNWLYASLYSVP